MPLVSVIMPVYNGAKYLREAIDSILSQTLNDFELIIINDGSTDESETIIQSYSDPRIVYLKNEINSKICVTLNKGLNAARGKYIARMDCDDIAVPERLAVQSKYLEKHNDIGIVGSDIIVFGKGITEYRFNYPSDKDECKAGLLFFTCFAHPAVMMKSEIIRKFQIQYNEEYLGLEDYELWWRLSGYCEVANIRQPLLRYRKHYAQETQNVSKETKSKLSCFTKDRLLTYLPNATESDIEYFQDYCFGRFEVFTESSFQQFIRLCKEICSGEKANSSKSFHRAIQITISKAIVYIWKNSTHIHLSKNRVLWQIFRMNILPIDWFIKFLLL